MRILSLDLGVKSLGICISDQTNTIAIPLLNFNFERNKYDEALKKILEMIKKYEIKLILLGRPLKTTGEKSKMLINVENFYKKLISNTEIEIKFVDERFSTKRGLELVEKSGNNTKKMKDVLAAYVMLNDYLISKI